jgi:peroxisomal enoyl-CoA hydratase 2
MAEHEVAVGGRSTVPFDELLGLVGMTTGSTVVRIERGPVQAFADAVLDASPEYRDPAAAEAAGFAAIPVPPTFPIAMTHWGAFADLQEVPAERGVGSARAAADALLGGDGLRLHGEEDFDYHRPLIVGDELIGTTRVTDVYRKDTAARSMIFVVTETRWRDRSTDEPVLTATRSLIWIPR